MDLKELSKTNAKLASFAVKVAGGHLGTYQIPKKDGTSYVNHKFDVFLISSDAQWYCTGTIKGTLGQAEAGKAKFKDGSTWAMSKVSFDTYAAAAHIGSSVPFRIDLAKTTMTAREDIKITATGPTPPNSVASIVRIKTNRCTDLIAVVKAVAKERINKSGETILDVELIDGSEITKDNLATIQVSVWGAGKVAELKSKVGEAMVFFNLSIKCSGGGADINHFPSDVLKDAPTCPKTTALLAKKAQLATATNCTTLTTTWSPHEARDVSGEQPLSCCAFLDYTSETPLATIPSITQLMWIHVEEPEPEVQILEASGTRLWFRTTVRDASGATLMGMPQRNALQLANCGNMEDFVEKHKSRGLNMPLLCHARVSRNVKERSGTGIGAASSSYFASPSPAAGIRSVSSGGASQPAASGGASHVTYVNHSLEAVEPVTWDPKAAPNDSYSGVLNLLNNCPPHDEGILFAYLSDLEADPYYGLRVCFDGNEGPQCAMVAVLVASGGQSKTTSFGDGHKVRTTDVRDAANPNSGDGTSQPAASKPASTLVGYCTLDSLPAFRLDPPRGKPFRFAVCLLNKKDDDSFHIHKLEYLEPDQFEDAKICFQKLRKFCKKIRPTSTDKRSHTMVLNAELPGVKKARTLRAIPTAASLDDEKTA